MNWLRRIFGSSGSTQRQRTKKPTRQAREPHRSTNALVCDKRRGATYIERTSTGPLCGGVFKVHPLRDKKQSVCTVYGATHQGKCSRCGNTILLQKCPACKKLAYQISTFGDGKYSKKCRLCGHSETNVRATDFC